jgi:hypothetical protein
VDDTFALDALDISGTFDGSAVLSAVRLVREINATTARFDVISNINTVETSTAVEKTASFVSLSAANIVTLLLVRSL